MIASFSEIVNYPMPSNTSKMVETMGANYPSTSSGTGVKPRSRGRRAKKGQETSWVYLNALEDFSDVRTRNRLMNAYNSSSSDDEPIVSSVPTTLSTSAHTGSNGLSTSTSHFHPNLHALHKFRRERKKGLVSDKNVVISYRPRVRLNLANRSNFYYRVSNKELEALQAFNFLDEFSVSMAEDDENEAYESFCFMDYNHEEQDIEQKQVNPLSITKDVEVSDGDGNEVVCIEHMPNINENTSLIELVPAIIGFETQERKTDESPENHDVNLLETTEVIVEQEVPSFMTDSLLWTEEEDTVGCSTEEFLDVKSCIFRDIMKSDAMEVSSDAIEDDGFHDKQVTIPPSPPLSVALDRLSLSDSCAESYFGSDSGGSSFLGGK